MDECLVHYETVKEKKLLNLPNKDFWSPALDAAVLRNERRLVQISKNLTDRYLIYIPIEVAAQDSI